MLDWTATRSRIERERPEIAVLSFGSVEQHGSHLPLGTDCFIGRALSRLVAQELDAYLLPTFPIVSAWEHSHFRGSVSLSGPTVRKLIRDVIRSLYDDDFRKIVIVNTHGGNWMIKPTVIELNREHADLSVIYAGGDLLAYRGQRPVAGELHAGQGETSVMLAIEPDTVKPPFIDSIPEDAPASFLDYIGVKGVSPSGVWGEPSKASAERGREALERRAKSIARHVRETLKRLEKLRD